MDSGFLSSILHISNDNAYKILEKLHSKGYLTKEDQEWGRSKRKFVIYKIKPE